jgi:hypothetical protein
MAMRCTGTPPTATIANRDGLQTVELWRGAVSSCAYIHVGDYLMAVGEKGSEALFR